MKNVFLLFLCLSITGCEIQYDGDKRLVVNGNFIDRNENPIPNQTIEIWVYSDNNSDLISFSKTDVNGNFEVVFPKARNGSATYEIKSRDENLIYQNKNFLNIELKDFNNYLFTINTNNKLFMIDDISYLTITLNDVNSNYTIVSITLNGLVANDYFYLNDLINTPTYYYDSYYSPVAKNQALTVVYDVRNNATQDVITLQEDIIIGSEDTTEYILDY